MPLAALLRNGIEEQAKGRVTEARATLVGGRIGFYDFFDAGKNGEDVVDDRGRRGEWNRGNFYVHS